MKDEEYRVSKADKGYGKDGQHVMRLTRVESIFVSICWDHDVENKISGDALALEFAIRVTKKKKVKHDIACWGRWVRDLHTHILEVHKTIPLWAEAGVNGGYWIGETEAEGESYYRAMIKRANTGYIKGSRGRPKAAVKAFSELAFNFEALAAKKLSSGAREHSLGSADSTAAMLLETLLEEMSGRPEFTNTLREMQEKYFSGGVLLDKERLAAMRRKAADLLAEVSRL